MSGCVNIRKFPVGVDRESGNLFWNCNSPEAGYQKALENYGEELRGTQKQTCQFTLNGFSLSVIIFNFIRPSLIH